MSAKVKKNSRQQKKNMPPCPPSKSKPAGKKEGGSKGRESKGGAGETRLTKLAAECSSFLDLIRSGNSGIAPDPEGLLTDIAWDPGAAGTAGLELLEAILDDDEWQRLHDRAEEALFLLKAELGDTA